MLFSKSSLLCATALLVGSAGAANAVTYLVNGPVGGGSVVGTISTNGTFGVLSASDFTGWNLVLTGNGGVTDTLDTGNSGVFVGGTKVSADATNLYFDFTLDNGSPSYFLFQKNFGSGTSYACASNADYPATPCFYGASLVPETFDSASAAFSTPTGLQIIGVVPGAVPEPATLAMMIGGFALAGAVMRRARTSVRFA